MNLIRCLVIGCALSGLSVAADLERPQSIASALPYATPTVRFSSKADQVPLAGTLSLPKGCQRCPAMILLGVAGPNDRDLGFAGHRAFAVIADALARVNVATLRWDDRGVAESGGDWSASGYQTLSNDAISAFEFLRRHERIDPESIGFFGLSEGSLIAGMAAAQLGPTVRTVVLASPPGLAGADALALQFESLLTLSGISGDLAQAYRASYEQFLELTRSAAADPAQLQALSTFLTGPGKALVPPYQFMPTDPAAQAQLFAGPWYQSQLDAQPLLHYSQIEAAVLLISGEKDLILPPAQHIPPIRRALPEAQARLYAGVSHLLQPSQGGGPAEYAQTRITIAPELLEGLVDWVLAEMKP